MMKHLLLMLLVGGMTIGQVAAEPLYISHQDFSEYRAGGAVPGSWNLYSEGELVAGLNLSMSSRCDVVIVAAGEPALDEWPLMQLRTPLQAESVISVSATQFHTYAAVMDLPKGRQDIELRYINDAVTEDEDRNLYIHSLFIVPHQTNVSITLLDTEAYAAERTARRQSLLDSARLAIENIRKGAVTLELQSGGGKALTNLHIRVEQLQHAFPWGCAVDDRPFLTDASPGLLKQYEQNFLTLFNAGVTGRALKWKFMQREPGPLRTQPLDAMLDWADGVGITMRGHCVFWECSNAVPQWVQELSDDEMRATVTARARLIGRKYRGRFIDLDVNNEMLHCGFFEQRLGSGIHRQMFHELHAADPGTSLYVNDYEILNAKMVEPYRQQIDELLASGVPLGGIGIQSHLDDTFDLIKARQVLDQLSDYGLPLKLTELTVRDVPPARQLQIYRDVLTLAFGHHAVDGIMQWGFWEPLHYRPEAALMRADGTMTPVGQVYTNLVFGDWWSRETLTPDAQGSARTRLFYGTHRISVSDASGGELYTTNLPFTSGDLKLTFTFDDLPEQAAESVEDEGEAEPSSPAIQDAEKNASQAPMDPEKKSSAHEPAAEPETTSLNEDNNGPAVKKDEAPDVSVPAEESTTPIEEEMAVAPSAAAAEEKVEEAATSVEEESVSPEMSEPVVSNESVTAEAESEDEWDAPLGW